MLHGNYQNTTDKNKLAPSEVPVDVPCSNGPLSGTSLGGSSKSYIELAKTFKSIHIRLASMGYKIENGRIYEPNKS